MRRNRPVPRVLSLNLCTAGQRHPSSTPRTANAVVLGQATWCRPRQYRGSPVVHPSKQETSHADGRDCRYHAPLFINTLYGSWSELMSTGNRVGLATSSRRWEGCSRHTENGRSVSMIVVFSNAAKHTRKYRQKNFETISLFFPVCPFLCADV